MTDSLGATVPQVPHANLTALAATIRTAHQGVMRAATNLVEHALTAGDALIVAKAATGHGKWLPWLKTNCDLSERQAQKYMAIARGRSELKANPTRGADLSLAAILRSLPSSKAPQPAGQAPRRKTSSMTRHDALEWWQTAPLPDRQRFLDAIGSKSLATALPPAWGMELIRAAIEVVPTPSEVAPAGSNLSEVVRLNQRIAELKDELHQKKVLLEKTQRKLREHEPVFGAPDDAGCLQQTPAGTTPVVNGEAAGHHDEVTQSSGVYVLNKA